MSRQSMKRNRTLLPRSLPQSSSAPASPLSSTGDLNFDYDDDNDENDCDEEERSMRQELSPKNEEENNTSGLETLRSALGGFGPYGDPDDSGSGGVGSLPHPEELLSSRTAASTGRGGSNNTDNCGDPRLNALLACMCPFVRLADAARRQGPAIFWRMLPSILASKAFWMSLLTLGLCDLATIVTVAEQPQNVSLSNSTIGAVSDASPAPMIGDKDGDGFLKLSFGLWSYSTAPEDRSANDDDVSFLEAEEERITTCTYHMHQADNGLVFWMDPIFRTARAFGIIAVIVGGMAMLTLWMGVIRVVGDEMGDESGTNRRPKKGRGRRLKTTVTIALILCSAFEGLTLLIFQTGVCGNGRMEKTYGQAYRDCEIAEGSSSPITAVVFWFLTGIALLKVPSDEPDTVRGSAESASEFEPDEDLAYGATDDGDDDEISIDKSQDPWWRRLAFPSKASAEDHIDRRRINGYTKELQFDDAYGEDDEEEYDTWRDNTLSIQMQQLT